MTTSTWRLSARSVINRVMDEMKGHPPAAVLNAIDKAYPFGFRDYHPYKMWLIERRAAMVKLGLAVPDDPKVLRELAKLRAWNALSEKERS